jgi:hypothetical protein
MDDRQPDPIREPDDLSAVLSIGGRATLINSTLVSQCH